MNISIMNIRITGIVALLTASIIAVAAYPSLRNHSLFDSQGPLLPTQGHTAVEAVFVLDTTGSMGGMIETAREKIWSIATTLAQGDPRPEISIGLVAFRDRGDEYVTRVIDLTTDLDAIYGELMQFRAAGGGDIPEAVNEALYDAVHRISWSDNPNSYRVVFLVGDAPPHMNYPDDVKYPETLAVAAAKGIVVNTIQCGNMTATTHHWQRIAALGQGRYFSVDQAGGGVTINSPFDEQISLLSRDLDRTRIYFGTEEEREAQFARAAAVDEIIVTGSRAAGARRAEYAMMVGAAGIDPHRSRELVTQSMDGSVDIDALDDAVLPPAIRELSADERRALIAEHAEQRVALEAQISELSQQRRDYIAERLAERGGAEDSLDHQLFEAVRAQAAERGIAYEGGPAY